MDIATDIYISRTNGAPCGDTRIQLFKGADSTTNQELRQDGRALRLKKHR